MFNKIIWKINFKNPEAIAPHDFFKMFNNWIPDSPEIFVDVADYQHVEDGPLIILVGHYVDYILDHSDRQLGFAYNRKRWAEPLPQDCLVTSFQEFIKRTMQMLDSPELKGKIALDLNQISLTFNDRAAAPNHTATQQKMAPLLTTFCNKLFGKEIFQLNFNQDTNRRLQVNIKFNQTQDLNAWLAVK